MNATAALLLEDHHVHSTFSDGTSSIEENISEAERMGLRRLGCVDHVRANTAYVPVYATVVRALRQTTALELRVGIEAKILNAAGQLDLPAAGLDAVDLIYVADHQFPWSDGPHPPREVRDWLDRGDQTAGQLVAALVDATIATMRRPRRKPLVLAHLFSILPKVGLSEDHVPDPLLNGLIAAAAETGTTIEISERWRCPSLRVIRTARDAGVTLVCSTDSHAATTIGRYAYVRSTLEGLTA
jgi:putative hydrolase